MSHSGRRAYSGTICAFLLGLAPILCGPTEAAETPVVCKVLHATIDGIYVDLGTDSGLKAGLVGWLRPSRARVEVVPFTAKSPAARSWKRSRGEA